jgi:outer membrane protein OmpA-like peptidoglycan-associated protein
MQNKILTLSLFLVILGIMFLGKTIENSSGANTSAIAQTSTLQTVSLSHNNQVLKSTLLASEMLHNNQLGGGPGRFIQKQLNEFVHDVEDLSIRNISVASVQEGAILTLPIKKLFGKNSAYLTKEAVSSLYVLARIFRDYPDTDIVLQSTYAKPHNASLYEERIEKITQYLIKQKIKQERIYVVEIIENHGRNQEDSIDLYIMANAQLKEKALTKMNDSKHQ